jgi:hypothetical protein
MTNLNFKDVADMSMYQSSEVGRLVGINTTRVRRWLKGYNYYNGSDIRHIEPVLHRSDSKASSNYASFFDLIDLLFAKQFLDNGISLQKLRKALDEATDVLGTNHFARETFFSDGKNIYLKVKKHNGNLLQLLSGGQWVIAPIIVQLAKQIEFDHHTGFARRWVPQAGGGLIVLDPLISFGRPSIKKGIDTASIYDLYIAEGESIARVCSWMKLTPPEVEAAVKFETAIAA